ncbi:MAG: pseudouridine synthase [Bdellovibrionota bacterium]
MSEFDPEILYLDDAMAIVNKPSGLLVHRSKESSDRVFLLQLVHQKLGEPVFPVNRIDRAASGAVVFARSSTAASLVQRNLQSSEALKEYLAFVRGEPPEQGLIERPLTSENGKPQEAKTSFQRISTSPEGSLLRVRIFTGRRHQIRRHLAHLRHHILGDTTYGKGRINQFFRTQYGLNRLFLHCMTLRFRHPYKEDWVEIRCRLPQELHSVLEKIPTLSPAPSRDLFS